MDSVPRSLFLLWSIFTTLFLGAHCSTPDHCEGTLYPDLCASTLAAVPDFTSKPLTEVICATINASNSAVRKISEKCTTYLSRHGYSLETRHRYALSDCIDLFSRTLDELESATAVLTADAVVHRVNDARTVLSAAITNQYTCLEGFAYVAHGGGFRRFIESDLDLVARLISNSLAMLKRVRPGRAAETQNGAAEGYGELVADGWPAWVGTKDRRLLQTAEKETVADVVVAQDGSGNFTTISDAVAAAPIKSPTRYVIYIKAGTYLENVEVGKNLTKVMLIGDGIGKTVVKEGRNVVEGWTTFRSATVAVVGNGFLMRDVTVENSAGPSKHQAVALRVGSDLSAFHRCSFVGYQDTLYIHSLRQFFRDCDVYGTVDVVFGNAAAVLQNCSLYARKPLANQQNTFTAQGRVDPNQNTGISIHKCKVAAASDLAASQDSVRSYLGRPWRQYSRTVYMQSFIDSLIAPQGWLEWDGSFALSTLYYGEYMNRGPGSDTSGRVTWPGYRVINSSTEASMFTVSSFIQGDEWLADTSIPFTSGLY